MRAFARSGCAASQALIDCAETWSRVKRAVLDQQPPDADIGLAVLAVIAQTHRAASGQFHPSRALDLEKERRHRIVDPDEGQTEAVERAAPRSRRGSQ